MDYRLSEDLDFTYMDESLNVPEIKNQFDLLCEWIKIESRIELKMVDEKVNKSGNYSFYLEYTGPLGGSKNSAKVDISSDEKICVTPEDKEIINEYSDLTKTYSLLSYSINEIMSEKMRSLMQRTAPRDLYDLWYFFEVEKKDIIDFIPTFKTKAEFKNLDPKEFAVMLNQKEEKFKKAWENQLKNQINEIPDFDEVWRILKKHLKRFDKNI